VRIEPDDIRWPYEQLAAILRERITDGTYPPGSRIPPIQALEAESGLSNMTVRRAVRLLVDEGLVITRPSRGTFVARKR
jgi:GntR family transcriptional regulator